MLIGEANIDIYLALFRGRMDLYALRWENNLKSGYRPVKIQENDSKVSARESMIAALNHHFSGDQTIGIYPLLRDNSSWFIIVDFDKTSWQTDSRQLVQTCSKYGVYSYIEVSRSANGAHVWIFFEEPLLASKTRAVLNALLKEGDCSKSFDRMFPNQDVLSGKGYGNLIALPLNGEAIKSGGSLFVEPDSFKSFQDQFAFLKSVQRNTLAQFDELYANFYNKISSIDIVHLPSDKNELIVYLKNKICLETIGIPDLVSDFLKKSLVISNQEYWKRKNAGLSLYKIPRNYNLINQDGRWTIIPRGFAFRLITFCRKRQIPHRIIDQRKRLPLTNFKKKVRLYCFQRKALEVIQKKDFGILVAPPGSGKTIMALRIIQDKKQPALILVHRKNLFAQWTQKVERFLGIEKSDIGKIAGKELRIGKQITVAMIQSLGKWLAKDDQLKSKFGLVILDECHHIPAPSFRDIISSLNAFYFYGFTATPFRSKGDAIFLFAYIGEIISKISRTSQAKIQHIETAFEYPSSENELDMPELYRKLVTDQTRNELICSKIEEQLKLEIQVLVITERKEHVTQLTKLLDPTYQILSMFGDDSASQRLERLNLALTGDFQVLISTGQLLGEGIDLPQIPCLFLVFPFSYEGKLVQYIGRVQRSQTPPTIFDFRDKKVAFLEKMFLKRLKCYDANFEKESKDQQLKLGIPKMPKKELKTGDEIHLFFDDDRAYYDASNAVSIEQINFSNPSIKWLNPAVCWKLRVLRIDTGRRIVFTEIIDYFNRTKRAELTYCYDQTIQQINFTKINTQELIRVANKAVIRKIESLTFESRVQEKKSRKIIEIIEVSIQDIEFIDGGFEIAVYLDCTGQEELVFIENHVITSKFDAIKNLILEHIQANEIEVEVTLVLLGTRVQKLSAKSKILEALTTEFFNQLRFELIVNTLKRTTESNPMKLYNPTSYLVEIGRESLGNEKFDSTYLLRECLKNSKYKHFRQLRYLSSRYHDSILAIRFSLEPFSFMLVIHQAVERYFVVWETLDSAEATYVWIFDYPPTIIEAQDLITEVRSQGKSHYIQDSPANFFRIIHSYRNPKQGFVDWQRKFEGRVGDIRVGCR